MFQRHLPWIVTLAVLVPTGVAAQRLPQYRVQQPAAQPGYEAGYQRGLEAGANDARRGSQSNFSIHIDFRRGDFGYRAQYGNRGQYQIEFRRAFASGYQTGFTGRRGNAGGFYGQEQYGNQPGPWANGRRGGPRVDVATQQGYTDGYEAGLDDGQDGRRFDPISERRYRSGDNRYNSRYGSRDRYKAFYRDGFLSGYEAGYRDATRYTRRW